MSSNSELVLSDQFVNPSKSNRQDYFGQVQYLKTQIRALQLANNSMVEKIHSQEQKILSTALALNDLQETKNDLAGAQSYILQLEDALRLKDEDREHLQQSLHHEFKCHGETERSLSREQFTVRQFIGFLNKLEFPRDQSQGITYPEQYNLGSLLNSLEEKKYRLACQEQTILQLQEQIIKEREAAYQSLNTKDEKIAALKARDDDRTECEDNEEDGPESTEVDNFYE